MKNKFIIAMLSLLITNTAFAEHEHSEDSTKITGIQQAMRKNLEAGNIDQARNTLEQAAGNFHSVKIELGLIQTLMQAGEYRHALSAAAHTQAEHPDFIDSTLFYAWLLAIGGQQSPALHLLDSTLERDPDNALLQNVKAHIKINRLVASELKIKDDIQLRPFAKQISDNFNYLQSGVILDDGIHILTTASLLEKRKAFKIINGMGEISTARRDTKFINDKLALLILEKPVKISRSFVISNSSPRAGTSVYLIGYSKFDQYQAKWPQLKTDILGTPSDTTNGYPIHIPYTAEGFGVYNRNGSLLGIASWNAVQNNAMIPLDSVQAYLDAKAENTNSSSQSQHQQDTAQAQPGMDEVYESALKNCVQLFGE